MWRQFLGYLWFLVAALSTANDVVLAQAKAPDYPRLSGFHEMEVSLSDSQPHIEWMFLPRSIRQADSGRLTMPSVSQAVVAGEQIICVIAGTACSVYALNAQNGEIQWRHDHSTRDYSGEPSVDQERVYFGSKAGVTALSRDDGRLLWHFPIEYGHGEGAPLPIAGRLYVSGYDGFSYALDCSTGEMIWKHNLVDSPLEDPPGFDGEKARFQDIAARPRGSASDGEIFVQSVFDQSRLIAISCQSGERVWEFKAKGWIGPAPTIVDAQVFICSQDEFLYCLDKSTGRELWKFKTPTWNSSRVAVHDGTVYLPVHRGRLYQLDAKSGTLRHAFDLPQSETNFGAAYTFPIVHGNSVVYVEGNGQVLNLNAESNTLHWQFRPRPESELFTDPVTDGQRIFVSSRQNDKRGESALIALGFGGQKTASILRGDFPGVETLFQDLAKIEEAQQDGPAGNLFYLSGTGQFSIVFPKQLADWDVSEQLAAAREAAKRFYSTQLAWLVEAAELDAVQELKLKIASNRAHQKVIRELLDLKTGLAKTSAQAFRENGVKDAFKSRCDSLSKSIAMFEPLARGSAVYEALPSILTDGQSLALKRSLLEQNSFLFRALKIAPEQEGKLRKSIENLTENPLDLRPGQIGIFFRENRAVQNAVRAVLDEKQRRIWEGAIER